MLSPCYGALGKACLPAIELRSRQKDASKLTDELLEALEFVDFACDALPPVPNDALESGSEALEPGEEP